MNIPSVKYIGLIEHLTKLDAREYDAPDIRITVAVLEEGKNTPRNFSLSSSYDGKKSAGGCFARLWAYRQSHDGKINHLFSMCGPEISHGDMADYEHGLNALKRISKKLDAMQEERGCAADCAESFGRWMEAAGIEAVYSRDENYSGSSWLNEGNWTVWTVGRTVNEIRARMAKDETAETVNT